MIPLAIGALALGRFLLSDDAPSRRRRTEGPAPVEVAPVEVGELAAVRELTGTLEPSAEVVVAAQVEGTVQAVRVDLADEALPGQALANLDARDYRQQAAATRAALRVARARAEAAESARDTARRALERTEALGQRGIASASALDDARARATEAAAAHAVAVAEVDRARAAHAGAQLQVERTTVAGQWSEEAGPRRVAARRVDEGARVSVGAPLFTLIDVDPLVLVVMVTAEDYAGFSVGQSVSLRTVGGADVDGRVARVAPAFDPGSRQARVEIEVPNEEGTLQPGAFVRARVVLDTLDDATIVPEVALTRRDGHEVVFAVDESTDPATVRAVPVQRVLGTDGRIAVRAEGLSGRVVTLGHQRLGDGAAVRVTGSSTPPVADMDATRGTPAREPGG